MVEEGVYHGVYALMFVDRLVSRNFLDEERTRRRRMRWRLAGHEGTFTENWARCAELRAERGLALGSAWWMRDEE